MQSTSKSSGFTLVELAVVLVILGFLVGGLLVPLATQVEQRNRRETEQQLEEIRQALLGYVIANGYLPCPATQTNPNAVGYGEESRVSLTGPCVQQFGILPWKTLSVREIDAWGQTRAAGDPWPGYFRYHVHDKFSDATPTNPISLDSNPKLNTPPGNARLSVWSAAGSLTAGSEPPVAVIYSTGPDNADDDGGSLRADGDNEGGDPDTAPLTPANWTTNNIYEGGTPTAIFDDLTIWMSRPVLFEKLVSAGRIP